MLKLAPARDNDQFVLSPNAAYYVIFLSAGYTSDEACALAKKAEANPDVLLEDIRLDKPRLMRL